MKISTIFLAKCNNISAVLFFNDTKKLGWLPSNGQTQLAYLACLSDLADLLLMHFCIAIGSIIGLANIKQGQQVET